MGKQGGRKTRQARITKDGSRFENHVQRKLDGDRRRQSDGYRWDGVTYRPPDERGQRDERQ